MNQIRKPIEEFAEWAEKNEDKNVFPEISENVSSYYIDRVSEKTYMMPYSFQNIAELKKLLKQYGGLESDSELLQMIVINICQNRYRGSLETGMHQNEKSENQDGEKRLPEYVYTF